MSAARVLARCRLMRELSCRAGASAPWHGGTRVLAAAAWASSVGSQQPSQHLQQLALPWHGFACHYAKGKGGKKGGKQQAAAPDAEDEAAADEEGPSAADIVANMDELMGKAVEYLAHELAGVRTGRANPGLLENIPVEAHGAHQPLKACGTVTVRTPQLLVVQMYDADLTAAVVKAIKTSPLGVTPSTEGSEVYVKLPSMTKETIDGLIKMVHMESEEALISIRRARQKGMDTVKKLLSGSADDKKRAEKQVQEKHDSHVAKVNQMKKQKEKELRDHKD